MSAGLQQGCPRRRRDAPACHLDTTRQPTSLWCLASSMHRHPHLQPSLPQASSRDAPAAAVMCHPLQHQAQSAPGGFPVSWPGPTHKRLHLQLVRRDASICHLYSNRQQPAPGSFSLCRASTHAQAILPATFMRAGLQRGRPRSSATFCPSSSITMKNLPSWLVPEPLRAHTSSQGCSSLMTCSNANH